VFNKQTSIPLTQTQAENILSNWLDCPVRCSQIQPLKGGMINSVLRLDFDKPPFRAVIKLNQPGDDGPYALDREVGTLRYLHTETQFPCPSVYCEDSSGRNFPFAFLLLECLPGVNMMQAPLNATDIAAIDCQLAEILADLHRHERPTFGKLDGPGYGRWSDLFLPRLYEVRSQPEVIQRLSADILSQVDYGIREAENVLADQGLPTLIHGDVWSGNIIVQQHQNGWQITGLVDPGSEYADVEMELAYLECFNQSRPEFMEIYTSQHALRPGYEIRRMMYWLLTYLIHVWLFGDRNYIELTANLAAQLRCKI